MKATNYVPGGMRALLTAIDNQDWHSLALLLCDDTCYEVSGFAPFRGKHAVLEYYRHERPILSGIHTIESIISEGDSGVCCGRFVGVKKNAERVDIRFADEIHFQNFRIRQRRVYFCQPLLPASTDEEI